jgi:polar amino acid transport system permease protein
VNDIFDLGFAISILPLLAEAALVTIMMTVAGFLVALPVGLLLVCLRLYTPSPISYATIAVIEFLRSTPLLAQLFFMYFVFPLWGIDLSATAIGIIALGLHYGAYYSEVFRGGIESVPRAQWEATTALNLGRGRTFFRIILPQALIPVVPAIGNYLIALFKETPILSAIAVAELMQAAKVIGADTFRYTEPITLTGLFFLAMSLISAQGVRWLEHRMRKGLR